VLRGVVRQSRALICPVALHMLIWARGEDRTPLNSQKRWRSCRGCDLGYCDLGYKGERVHSLAARRMLAPARGQNGVGILILWANRALGLGSRLGVGRADGPILVMIQPQDQTLDRTDALFRLT
jgi:hypothetical protein